MNGSVETVRPPVGRRTGPWLSDRTVLRLSGLLLVLLVGGAWMYLWAGEGLGSDLFSAANRSSARAFVDSLLGRGTEEPAFFRPERWAHAGGLALATLKMSLMAVGMAGIGMVVTVLAASRRTQEGTLTLFPPLLGRLLSPALRLAYVLARGIPELFWAMLIVFVFKPGVLPGALALAVHNFGILGKLCTEVVEDADLRPARSLRSSGAGFLQVLVYGVLPIVTPKFLTYLLYRWEDIIRATIVVGFVSAGGLGLHFRLSMNWFHYTEVTLLLVVYFLLVVGVDAVCGGLRALAKDGGVR